MSATERKSILKLMLFNISTHAHLAIQLFRLSIILGSVFRGRFSLLLHFHDLSIRLLRRLFANPWIMWMRCTLLHMLSLRFVRQSKFNSSSPISFITRPGIRHCQKVHISDSDSRTISVQLRGKLCASLFRQSGMAQVPAFYSPV